MQALQPTSSLRSTASAVTSFISSKISRCWELAMQKPNYVVCGLSLLAAGFAVKHALQDDNLDVKIASLAMAAITGSLAVVFVLKSARW
jgi:hypothetical protein